MYNIFPNTIIIYILIIIEKLKIFCAFGALFERLQSCMIHYYYYFFLSTFQQCDKLHILCNTHIQTYIIYTVLIWTRETC